MILKMAAILAVFIDRPESFSSRHNGRISYARIRLNSSSGFRDAIMAKNQRWLPAAIFVDGPEAYSGKHN